MFESFLREFYKIEQNELKVKRDTFDWIYESITEGSENYIPKMNTDITLFNDKRKIIIDAKYTAKSLTKNPYGVKEKLNEKHLYQLNAYLNNTQPKDGQVLEGILLYPMVKDDFDHQFKIQGKYKVSVKSIDLNQDFQKISEDLKMVIA